MLDSDVPIIIRNRISVFQKIQSWYMRQGGIKKDRKYLLDDHVVANRGENANFVNGILSLSL